jgi:hypothetical protein
MIVVSFGGGTNSTALLVGMHELGERPDAILFADTGGEKPHTYRHIEEMQKWLVSVGFPEIVIVRDPSKTLYEDCITRNSLPSVAFGGYKTCSQRFKLQPQERWRKQNGFKEAVCYVGIDADESHRAGDYPLTRYPLIEWGWGREECVEAIKRAGIMQPGKSSCFFCPNNRPHEIKEMAEHYPEIMAKAIAMEDNNQTEIAGLGRSWRWKNLIATDDMYGFQDTNAGTGCVACYDG